MVEVTIVTMFLCSMVGCLAMLVIEVISYFEKSRLPNKYRHIGFWINQILFIIIAGGLAVIILSSPPSLFKAIIIGSGARSILLRFASSS